MTLAKISVGPQMMVEISDAEREIARATKTEFKTIIKELDEALKVVLDLRDAVVNQNPTKEIL